MTFLISKKRQQILDQVIEKQTKKIKLCEQEIQKRKKNVQEWKKVFIPTNDNAVEEFTGYKLENDSLKDLYLTNIFELIRVDIEKPHKRHNDFGYFYNEKGKCVCLYLGTNAGLYWSMQGSDKNRYLDENGKIITGPFESASYKDFDIFIPFHCYEEQDCMEGADISLDDWILSIVAKGYFYLLKETPTGINQYNK